MTVNSKRMQQKKSKDNFSAKLLSLTLKVISWLRESRSQSLLPYLTVASSLSYVLKHRGSKGLIQCVKDTRTALLHYLSGEHLTKKVLGVKLLSSGIPTILSPFVSVLEATRNGPVSTFRELRLLFTLLYCTRALSVGREPSTTSITDTGPPVPSIEQSKIIPFWRELGFRPAKALQIPRLVRWRTWHMSSKSGPNGPAILTSMLDLLLIRGDPRLLESLYIVGGEEFKKTVELLLLGVDFVSTKVTKYLPRRLRKLVWFPDKEAKVRVVAIVDYISQSVLFPLHCYLYKVLKRIPQDCTFDQGSFIEKIKGWEYFSSVDLSDATDRFPIAFISQLLKGLFPASYVEAWEYIMVGLPFEFAHKNKVENLKYARGTPMGAYTSWATFAIAHHFVVYLSCLDIGVKWSEAKYVMLGDDILIGCPLLSAAYKARILGLGVTFSTLKTHDSSTLSEFAKRLCFRGVEVTPFPMPAVKAVTRFYQLVPVLYAELRRGWDFGQEVSQVISSFYQDVLGYNAKFCKNIRARSKVVERLMLTMRGELPARDMLESVFEVTGQTIPEDFTQERCAVLLQKAVMVSFNKSVLSLCNKSPSAKPFGTAAVNLYEDLMRDKPEIVTWASKSYSKIPLIALTIRLKGAAAKLINEGAENIMNGGDWPLLLKVIGLPDNDSVFVERQRDRLVRAAASLAYELKNEALKAYEEYKKTGGDAAFLNREEVWVSFPSQHPRNSPLFQELVKVRRPEKKIKPAQG